MSSSTEARPAPGTPVLAVLPELRAGDWTRLDGGTALGDRPTEQALGGLAARTRDAARAQGYATGWAEGRREAGLEAAAQARLVEERTLAERRRHEAEQRAALEVLRCAAAALAAATARACAEVEARALGLARELTETLVGHELRVAVEHGEDGADLARRALAATTGPALAATTPGAITLRVPAPGLDAGGAELLAAHGVVVVPDASLQAGDAVADTDGGAIDLRISTGLARVREALR